MIEIKTINFIFEVLRKTFGTHQKIDIEILVEIRKTMAKISEIGLIFDGKILGLWLLGKEMNCFAPKKTDFHKQSVTNLYSKSG